MQNILVRKGNLTSKDHSLHPNVEQHSGTNEPDHPTEGDNNVPDVALKLEFWAKALQEGVYLINLSLSRAIRLQVPQSLWLGRHLIYD